MRAAFLGLMLLAAPLPAQEPPASQRSVAAVERRVGTLESQMRAVQRQVFPGGDKRFFEPENAPVSAAPAAPTVAPGTPATSPLVDLTVRVDALERQQKALTGQVEQLQFRTRQLDEALAKFRADAEFRMTTLEGGTPPGGATVTPPGGAVAPPPGGMPATVPGVVPGAVPPAGAKPGVKPGAPVAKPGTPPATAAAPAKPVAAGTPAAEEAAYRAALAKWTAKDYPAAAVALQDFVTANPKAARAGHAQFWAGRAMMEQGQHAQAAKAFLSGYQNYPRGERAPNSLLWLGKALTAMKQPKAACQALDQLASAYPDKLTGQLKTDADAARTEAKCR
ncbi:tetratricopeptide repeat protein [Sandaracinobacteroides saxicola]|uniref:Cell division coordinator CpoB n=1 Tax=Sandaracinobacteroides saxicola TaxID=2759707 RepID=A0A7G5II54_9SPHN|nr:tetratricopeptide repeat protein [Sandaracinobacteroides saxicola]QMW23046.1 tetratricopeptide repeat protein [Sandaracinobacteroides saxicola]